MAANYFHQIKTNRENPVFGRHGPMELRKPKRPQHMFLFDPDFRHRLDEDVPNAPHTPAAERKFSDMAAKGNASHLVHSS